MASNGAGMPQANGCIYFRHFVCNLLFLFILLPIIYQDISKHCESEVGSRVKGKLLCNPRLLWTIPRTYTLRQNSMTHKYYYRQVSSACRRCSNYIFILNLTSGFNGLGIDNYKMRREAFMLWDLVRIILDNLRYFLINCNGYPRSYLVLPAWKC